jgi:hypothetical protein
MGRHGGESSESPKGEKPSDGHRGVGALGKRFGSGDPPLDPMPVFFKSVQLICTLVKAISLELCPLIVILWGAGKLVTECKSMLCSGISIHALGQENSLGNCKLDR